MPDTPNYNQSTVAGDTWQRACSIYIDNPLGGNPTITFVEEKVYVIGDKTIKEQVGTLSEVFDATNPAHGFIYYYLNEEYVKLRDIRDTPPMITSPAAPPIP